MPDRQLRSISGRLRRRFVLGAAALAAVALLAGCTAGDRAASATPSAMPAAPGAPTGEPAGELTVFAAASLTRAFDALAEEFEARHPAVDVRPIRYDGSRTLATQLVEGAPADVFAAADEASMARVVEAGLASAPALFASNTLVIVVPRDNPGGVKTIEDLGWREVTVVLCAPEVPCGAASERLLADNLVEVDPVSLEQNVTGVLTKVAAGDADAGLVYATDVRGRDDVRPVRASGAERVVNRYAIAPLADAANPDAAAAFVAFVTSDEGQAVLADRGFGAP